MLDKVGVQPELVRIGKFKSAGDQLLRSDMSVRRLISPLDSMSMSWFAVWF